MIGRSISLAWGQLGDPAFRGVLVRGVLLALVLLGLLTAGVVWLASWVVPETVVVPWWGPVTWLDETAGLATFGFALLLSAVLMVPVASAMTSLFLDDVANAVEAEHYPDLPPVRPIPLGEALRDSLGFTLVVVGVNAAALIPALLFAPFAPLIFLTVNGWLLGREYFQLAALRHEGRDQARALARANGGRIWLTGMAMALPLYVPVVNLLVPTVGAAAFVHLYHAVSRGGRTSPGPRR